MSRWSSFDDVQLVSHALAGSQEAFRELVERYERPVYSLIVRMVRDPETAEDLAQETFLKAWGALSRYDGQHKLASWLFKIAHNATIDQMRRKGVPTVSLTPDSDDQPDPGERLADPSAATPEQAALSSDLGVALGAALDRLRPEYREVMVLRFQEGLAYEEIATVMALPLGTVKTHIHRARKEMAALMEAAGWARAEHGAESER